MPRGGKRPGAGAPRSNLNALKHGRRAKLDLVDAAIRLNMPAARDSRIATAAADQARSPEDIPRLRASLERRLDALRWRVNRALANTNPDAYDTLRRLSYPDDSPHAGPLPHPAFVAKNPAFVAKSARRRTVPPAGTRPPPNNQTLRNALRTPLRAAANHSNTTESISNPVPAAPRRRRGYP